MKLRQWIDADPERRRLLPAPFKISDMVRIARQHGFEHKVLVDVFNTVDFESLAMQTSDPEEYLSFFNIFLFKDATSAVAFKLSMP
jgi:hypothetical protein